MSERLPYEEQLADQWQDLSLPNEDMAWADMKQRLDEDDRKPIFPFWLRGCAGWALLGLVILGMGWWLLRPDHWFDKSAETEQTATQSVTQSTSQAETKQQQNIPIENTSTLRKEEMDTAIAPPIDNINAEPKPVSTSKAVTTGNGSTKVGTPVTAADNIGSKLVVIKPIRRKNPSVATAKYRPSNKKSRQPSSAGEWIADTSNAAIGNKKTNTKTPEDNSNLTVQQTTLTTADLNNVNPPAPATTVAGKTPEAAPVKDSTAQPIKGDIAKKEEPVKKEKKDSSQKKKFEWSGGIGLQQQLPVAGQKLTPYNAQGRKGTLADYIPSVYVRFSRPEKWFLQAEFRYGAPSPTKALTYQQTRVNDTGSAPRFYFLNSYTVKKTYYHQLPLSFNYVIRPGWSVGAGIQWNSFYRAIAENEVLYHDNTFGTDSVTKKSITSIKKDTTSAFKRSFFMGLVETQYTWKRFSIGARYSFGLQPYIQFTLPGRNAEQAKLNSLQLFIRYELWRKKRK